MGHVGGGRCEGDGKEIREEGWAVGRLFIPPVGEVRRGHLGAPGLVVLLSQRPQLAQNPFQQPGLRTATSHAGRGTRYLVVA